MSWRASMVCAVAGTAYLMGTGGLDGATLTALVLLAFLVAGGLRNGVGR